MTVHAIPLSDAVILHYVGPPLEEGPLPAFFYFSISGKESLTLDPFNQPVTALSGLPLRIFSLDVPGHTTGHNPRDILSLWAKEIREGHNFLSTFCSHVENALRALSKRGCLIDGKVGVAGLSRGAFLALHAAARLPTLNPILGFAPLITPRIPSLKHLDVFHLIPDLMTKTIRLQIGANDTLVGTEIARRFAEELPIELIIYPSIGHKGHGTPPEMFHEGALWMAKQLGSPP